VKAVSKAVVSLSPTTSVVIPKLAAIPAVGQLCLKRDWPSAGTKSGFPGRSDFRRRSDRRQRCPFALLALDTAVTDRVAGNRVVNNRGCYGVAAACTTGDNDFVLPDALFGDEVASG